MAKFHANLNKAYRILLEQDAPEGTEDATQPQPAVEPGESAIPEPEAGAKPDAQIPPEGYVDLIRLLAKALIINIPAGEIDSVFTETPITNENAYEVKDILTEVINKNASYESNPENLDNIHYKKFYQSINENNFIQKLNTIRSAMKRYTKV